MSLQATKNILKKQKKYIDLFKKFWYITYAHQKSAERSLKTKQNVNYIKSGKNKSNFFGEFDPGSG